MSMLVWVMMAIAIWHFAVWFPDRFWGGIVGALLAAILGSVVIALIASGFSIPGQHDTHLGQALLAIPGSVLGLLASYLYGARTEGVGAAREPRAY